MIAGRVHVRIVLLGNGRDELSASSAAAYGILIIIAIPPGIVWDFKSVNQTAPLAAFPYS
jgi:hypothetical protein